MSKLVSIEGPLKGKTFEVTLAGASAIQIPAGGKIKVDLPGTSNTLDLVTKVSTTKGNIFVSITSFGEYDTFFKQVDVHKMMIYHNVSRTELSRQLEKDGFIVD